MASTLLFIACFVFFQLSTAHRIEIITTSRPDGTIPEFDCKKPTDIVFILDASKRMGIKDFWHEIDFVKRLIDDMDISENMVRIGVATVSGEMRVDFSLNTYKTKTEINQALSTIDDSVPNDPHGKAHTWLALEYLRTTAFSADNGGRAGVPKVAIILTDFYSSDNQKTMDEAILLRDSHIRVYAIGVEHYSLDELLAIATKPEYIYLSSDFNALKDIEVPIRESVCKIVCGVAPLDVIFLMDESSSLWNFDVDTQNEFVDSFIRDSLIGPKYTQIGVVTFSTDATNRFFLNQHQNHGDLISAVKNMKRSTGESYTNKGLRLVKEQGFTSEHGGRPGVPHVVIVFTDGQSTSPLETRDAAVELQRSGVTVFVVGIGGNVDINELNIMAGDPARVFQVRNYSGLKAIEPTLFASVCTLRHTQTGL